MPNLYRRKDSEYFWCWGYNVNGEKWYASTRQKTERAAQKAARAIERERLEDVGEGLAPITVAEALDVLAKHKARKQVREATATKFATKRVHLERVLGAKTNIHDLTLGSLERYVDERRKDLVRRVSLKMVDGVHQRTVREHPTKDQTIAMEVDFLLSALRRLRKHGLFAIDPDTLRPDVVEEATVEARDRWLTVEEFERLHAEVAESRRRYLAIYCLTGMRFSELYQCERIGDVLHVTQTKGNARVGEVKIRHVPLSPPAIAILDRYPLPWPVWPTSRMVDDLKRACSRAGMDRVSANDLRRTFCSWLCNAGVPELTVTKLMGHSSSAMVRRVYAQLAPSTLEDAVLRLPVVAVTHT